MIMLTVAIGYLMLAHVSLVGTIDSAFITPGQGHFTSTWALLTFIMIFLSIVFFCYSTGFKMI